MTAENLPDNEKIKVLENALQKSNSVLNKYKKEHEEFIRVASHDLQAPLRKLSTFVERLSHKFKNSLDEDAGIYIQRIIATTANMRSLIDSLSDLSSITETKNELEQCDLDEVLKNVLKKIQPTPIENSLWVTQDPLPVAEGDYCLLNQLFTNIIDNAVKFQHKNRPLQIQIAYAEMNPEEKKNLALDIKKVYHKIDIIDNGIGFRQEDAERIFQPFVRLHGKSAYPGNGMGLAICKKIMERHEGLIYADSTINEGARFTIILPEIFN